MKRRHAAFVAAALASLTLRHGKQLIRYGTATSAASGPGHGTNSIKMPDAAHKPSAALTVARAPKAVAMEPMFASLSGSMSCTAPKAWAAMPHRKKAINVSVDGSRGGMPREREANNCRAHEVRA